jgi:hypothetical protein
MKPEPMDNRDEELRRALVATVDLTPFNRRRPSARFLIGGIAAFVLAGALTGGAVVSVATHGDPQVAITAGVRAAAQEIVVDQNATLIGAPTILAGSGTTTINLGRKPARATNIVVGFECVDAGDFVTKIDGHVTPMQCSSSDVLSPQGSEEPTFGTGKHSYEIQVAEGKRFTVWISWLREAHTSPSAAQRAELADGVVSRAEYLAAYNRFAGCMAAAGFPIGDVPQDTTLINYATDGTDAGDAANNRCYPIEFKQVDSKWQQENPQAG